MKKNSKFLSSFQRKYLEKSLEKDLPKQYSQRIQIMLLADEGKTQTQICQALGCSQSTARHWIATAKSGQAHQWDHSTLGRPQVMDEQCLQRLKELVTQSPREVKVPNCDFTYSARHWTGKKLSEHMSAEFGIKISDRHINRLLKNMGLSTRPQPSSGENNQTKYPENSIVIDDIKGEALAVSDETFLAHFFKKQDFMELSFSHWSY
ncbi:MAG: helix-turn-helix domain-containing protein [Limnoraphis robusta]